jgi:hypothetical protein
LSTSALALCTVASSEAIFATFRAPEEFKVDW